MKGLEITNITKTFGQTRALDAVNLTLPAGKIYGLLGRNGAGKSTLLNLATNRLFPDTGEIRIDGDPVMENDAATGKIYLMSVQNLYPESMKVKAGLDWSKNFYPGFDEAYARTLAAEYKLDLNKKIKNLSTGYQSLFKLIIALSSNAPYLFLDEPVLGLDANNRRSVYRKLLEKFAENGCTIILSTHIIEEVAGMVEEIIIIHDGKVLKQAAVDELLAGHYVITGPEEEVQAYAADKKVVNMSRFGGMRSATIEGTPGPHSQNLTTARAELQDLFIELTNASERSET